MNRRLSSYVFQTFTTADGLADDSVQTVLVGQGGEVWVGATRGVSLFNGREWRTFASPDEIPSNDMRALIAARGAVWVAGAGGIVRYDGATWKQFDVADGLLNDRVHALTVGPDGSVWAAYESPSLGLSRLSGVDTWEEVPCSVTGPASLNVAAGTLAPDGSTWFATDRGVNHFDGRNWRTYTVRDGLPTNSAQTLAVAPEGEVWAGTPKGLAAFDGNGWRTVATGDVRLVALDADGHVWAVTPNGLAQLDGDQLVLVPGAPSTDVRAILTTDEALWIATRNGVARLDAGGWRTFTTADGLTSDDSTSLALGPDGSVWVGFADARLGFNYYDGQRWQFSSVSPTLADDDVTDILNLPDGT